MPLQCCLSKLDMLLFGVDLRVVGCGQSNFDRIVIKFHIRATATMFEWLNAEDCICQYAIQFPVVSLSKFPEDWDRCLQEDDWHLFQSHVAFCLHRKVWCWDGQASHLFHQVQSLCDEPAVWICSQGSLAYFQQCHQWSVNGWEIAKVSGRDRCIFLVPAGQEKFQGNSHKLSWG